MALLGRVSSHTPVEPHNRKSEEEAQARAHSRARELLLTANLSR